MGGVTILTLGRYRAVLAAGAGERAEAQALRLPALIAALTRMAAAMGLTPAPMLHIAAAAWVAPSGGFVVALPPALTRPRP